MATTLNVTVNGIKFTADTSQELALQVNGVTAMTVDASQNVAFTNPPSFPSATILNGVTYIWPSADGASGEFLTTDGVGTLYWSEAAGLPTMNIVSGTTQAAVANNHYVLTNAATTTVTLPASPAAGDVVWVTVANGRVDNVIARNGSNINSLAQDMTVDNANAGIQLRYADATRGWVFT